MHAAVSPATRTSIQAAATAALRVGLAWTVAAAAAAAPAALARGAAAAVADMQAPVPGTTAATAASMAVAWAAGLRLLSRPPLPRLDLWPLTGLRLRVSSLPRVR